jgi:hypothetical protein
MSYTLTPAEQIILDEAERINAKRNPRPPVRPVQRAMEAPMPVVGSMITVRLPGEIMRCRVDRIIDDNRVIIEINSAPMSRSHQYRMGDNTGARRRLEYGQYIWEALDDRDFIANRSPTEPVPQATVNPLPKAKVPAKKVMVTRATKAKKRAK